MRMIRRTLAAGLAAACCSAPMGFTHAASVLGLQLKDVGSHTANGPGNYSPVTDGVAGAFIDNVPLNIQTFSGTYQFTGDIGTGTILAQGAENLPYTFSSGTMYGSSYVEPFTYGNGMVADISNGVLSFSSLDFGINIVPGTVWLPPDPGTLTVNWVVPTGPDTYDVSFMWSRYFLWDPLDTGYEATYHVYLEGTMTTAAVPVPGAFWLLLSGIAGFAGVVRRRTGPADRGA